MIRFLEPAKISYQNIIASKLRSFLTITGIIIGVAAVIIIFAVGESAQKLIIDQIKGVGSNLVAVLPGASEEKGPPAALMGIPITTLTYNDLKAVMDSKGISGIESGAGYVSGTVNVTREGVSLNASVTGTTASYVDVENAEVIKGRFFDSNEEKNLSRIVVLGSKISQELFKDDNPINKKVKIKDQNFSVVGVLKERGSGSFGASSQDDSVFIPLKTTQKLILGINHLGYARFKVSNSEMISFAKDEIASILRREHNIGDPKDDDFTVRDQAAMIEILDQITDVLRYFLLAVGSISLLVGGIGIMNIMLIVINQRVREVGLRKAVGARDIDILIQFLIESATISSIGGALGIILGVTLSFLISVIVGALGYDWDFIVSLSSLFVAALVSISIGIIFGIYPAKKATKISPIESLRYE
jgi:putative ABC transport system permease protein